ncbi:MAG: hypothetical protein R2710_03370 [Acidimicrobiales bacterium]
MELGLIRIDGTDFEVANPAMAAPGSMIGDDPVPVEAVLDAYEQLRSVIPPVEAAFRSALEADGSRRGSDGAGLPRPTRWQRRS